MLKHFLLTAAAMLGALSCVAYGLFFQFSRPELTHTQMFLETWPAWVAFFACLAALRFSLPRLLLALELASREGGEGDEGGHGGGSSSPGGTGVPNE